MQLTRSEKNIVRNFVRALYASRNGRTVRIMDDGSVVVTVDGNGTQMQHGIDETGGTIFAGYAVDLLAAAVMTEWGK